MATVWVYKSDSGERYYESGALLDLLSDGSLQPDDQVRNSDHQQWIAAKDAARQIRHNQRDADSVRTGVLWALSLVSLIPGLIMLFDPSMGARNPFGGGDLVNYHKLAMGVAFTLCGAIFLAAALRPR